MNQTPEFLCWSIDQACPLRELLPPHQPEMVERHLRSARETAAAAAAGRVHDDLATSADGQLGFRVSEALAIYGGETALKHCCGSCPANAIADRLQSAYGGCFGMFPVPEPRAEFLARTQKFARNPQLFPPTQYLWYGWWMESPLRAAQITYLAAAFGELRREAKYADDEALQDLASALARCQAHGLSLSTQLFPAGQVEGTWWNLVPHCPICRAPWETCVTSCAMCGRARHPASPKKRRVRGTRPYRPLTQLQLAAETPG